MMESEDQFEKHVAERLKRLRVARGLTLDQLADLSGVSRAMISRIERSEASPTAALLARLCSALGVSLSVFFASTEAEPSPLTRRVDQPVWRDPESGYVRRAISPQGTGSGTDIVEVEFPAGAEVRFPGRPTGRSQTQHVWVFEGIIELTIGETVHRLEAGDCLFMNVGDVHGYRNPTDRPARYAVVISLGT
ncbi:helix-turn-helix domain-containing protein [Rhizobium rhizophilum]|nr:XRE family transcriptional regulator [Rhizobium rhizophilum]